MKKLALCAFTLAILVCANAQSPTWSGDIACLLFTHCTPCHHENGIAPFSLTTYVNARDYMSVIYGDVNNHIMPPYPPDVTYQQYMQERHLTSDEISLLDAWINGGGPEGDSTLAPPAPVYASGPVITSPGFTARIPTFTVPQLSTDLYRCFIVSNPFPATEYVTGIEVIPGNNAAVHHVIVYQDSSSKPVQLDSASLPGPGYTEFGGDGSNSAQMLGAWTPGSQPYFTPAGMGIEVPAGARIILQVHYPAGSSGMVDSTRVNLQFSGTSNLRKVFIEPVLAYTTDMVNGPLNIPANTIDTFYEKYTVPEKVTLLAVAPHAHLICTDMITFGVEPTGDTIPFISDAWNFHWQGIYPFKRATVVPQGTKIYGRAIYNNTTSNVLNPNNPPQDVSAGESTTDEMMIFFFSYTLYQAGDEALVFDTSTYIHSYDNCTYAAIPTGISDLPGVNAVFFPNPTTGLLDISIPGTGQFNARVSDITGSMLFTTRLNGGYNEVNLSQLSAGMYFITLSATAANLKPQTLRVVKQ